jgi:hypothetical protein
VEHDTHLPIYSTSEHKQTREQQIDSGSAIKSNVTPIPRYGQSLSEKCMPMSFQKAKALGATEHTNLSSRHRDAHKYSTSCRRSSPSCPTNNSACLARAIALAVNGKRQKNEGSVRVILVGSVAAAAMDEDEKRVIAEDEDEDNNRVDVVSGGVE